MLTTLLLQGSLLVSPMELGEQPPQTCGMALIAFRQGQSGEGDIAAAMWRNRKNDFASEARRRFLQPEQDSIAAFGTFWADLVSPDIAAFVLTAQVGEIGEVATPIGPCVVQRIERDAACRQIFVAGTDDAARAKAQALLQELRDGADFRALARARSDDKASALRGGDLAIYERGAEDALVREEAFKLRVAEIGGPFATPMGLHLLQRVEPDELDPRLRDDTWARARAILVQFTGAPGADPAFQREHAASEQLADELAARIRGGEDMAAVARENNDDPGGRERGGDIGWVRRGTTRMPSFFDRLFTEPPGTLIGPIAASAGFVILRREDPGPRSRIDLRKNVFIDLEQWVRKLGESKVALGLDHATRAAADAAHALDQALGSPVEWGLVEGCLDVAQNADAFARACEALPQTHTGSGGTVALRELATAYAKTFAKLEFKYLMTPNPDDARIYGGWLSRESTINAGMYEVRQRLAPLGDVALEELEDALGIRDPRVVIPVYFVADAPWPGGVTHRATRGSITLVDADENQGTQLVEVVLHEACHALELAATGQTTVLDELRQRLASAGIERGDRRMRDVPHTLMFVTAAWVVRHVFDAAHQDYGDVAGYYAKVSEATAAVRGPWTEHLDGKRTREEALNAIVATAKGG